MTALPAPVLRRIPEAAAMLGCSRKHVYDLIAAGHLSAVNIGIGRSLTRVREDELAAYITRKTSRTRKASA